MIRPSDGSFPEGTHTFAVVDASFGELATFDLTVAASEDGRAFERTLNLPYIRSAWTIRPFAGDGATPAVGSDVSLYCPTRDYSPYIRPNARRVVEVPDGITLRARASYRPFGKSEDVLAESGDYTSVEGQEVVKDLTSRSDGPPPAPARNRRPGRKSSIRPAPCRRSMMISPPGSPSMSGGTTRVRPACWCWGRMPAASCGAQVYDQDSGPREDPGSYRASHRRAPGPGCEPSRPRLARGSCLPAAGRPVRRHTGRGRFSLGPGPGPAGSRPLALREDGHRLHRVADLALPCRSLRDGWPILQPRFPEPGTDRGRTGSRAPGRCPLDGSRPERRDRQVRRRLGLQDLHP